VADKLARHDFHREFSAPAMESFASLPVQSIHAFSG